MEKLKAIDFCIRNFKITFLCLFILYWTYISEKTAGWLKELFSSPKKPQNKLVLLVIIASCLLSLYLLTKSDTAEHILRKRYNSVNRAIRFGAYLQNIERRDDFVDHITESFKRDFSIGGYYWAKYHLWRDNLINYYHFFQVKLLGKV